MVALDGFLRESAAAERPGGAQPAAIPDWLDFSGVPGPLSLSTTPGAGRTTEASATAEVAAAADPSVAAESLPDVKRAGRGRAVRRPKGG